MVYSQFIQSKRFDTSSDHIGQRPNGKYTCEWQSCSRKGKNQSSRFALIAHLRSHTADKPFICVRVKNSRKQRQLTTTTAGESRV